MLKRSAFLLVFLLLLGATAFADIADNFKAGGISLDLSGSANLDAGRVFDPANQSYSYSFSVSGGPSFFLVDNFAFFVSLRADDSYDHTDDLNYSERASFGADIGLAWYLPLGPDNPFVPAVGFGAGMSIVPGTKDVVNGVSYDNPNYLIQPYVVGTFSLHIFLNERLALVVSVSPELYFWRQLFAQNDPLSLALNPAINISIGIAGFFPPRSYVLFPMQ